MRAVHVFGFYLVLSTVAMFLLLAIPGAPRTFAPWPITLQSLGFVLFLPQSVEFVLTGMVLNTSVLPSWDIVMLFGFDFLLGIALMLVE